MTVRRLPELVTALAILLLGAAIYVYAHRDGGALDATRAAGLLVADRLDAYRDSAGSYPAELRALEQGGESIPQPAWGRGAWHYQAFDSARYELYVRSADGALTLRLDPQRRRWSLDN